MSDWKLGGVEIPTPSTVVYQGGTHETLAGNLIQEVFSTDPEEPGELPRALVWHDLPEEDWRLLKQLCDQGADDLSGPEGRWWVRPYMGSYVPESFPTEQVMTLT